MLYEVRPSTGELKKMQLDSHPQCALFEPRILPDGQEDDGAALLVRYHGDVASQPAASDQDSPLRVPLEPDVSALEKINVNLHGSPAAAYRMGNEYDEWFSHRFGHPVLLVYLGDGKRQVLGQTLPPKPAQGQQQQQQEASQPRGWIASLASYVTGTGKVDETTAGPWLTFADVAPLMVTSESSLQYVREHLLDGQPVEMYKFRPNIVVDGEGEQAWAEDFWAELAVAPRRGDSSPRHTLLLTGNCVRCTSLNVDYQTGKPAVGEPGTVLKKLMKDRRVDSGSKWSPVFGRYAFLDSVHHEGFTASVGDEVEVTRRNTERSVWDWPGL